MFVCDSQVIAAKRSKYTLPGGDVLSTQRTWRRGPQLVYVLAGMFSYVVSVGNAHCVAILFCILGVPGSNLCPKRLSQQVSRGFTKSQRESASVMHQTGLRTLLSSPSLISHPLTIQAFDCE